MTTPREQLRRLGFLETYFHTRLRIGVDTCVVVTARYTSSSGRTLDKPLLFAALEDVVHKHTELGARVSRPQSAAPTWVCLPLLDFNHIVDFVDADSRDLESVLEAQLLRGFDVDAELPLWRLVILSDNTVVFAYDHTMGDGQSGLGFHLSLLASLKKIKEPPNSHSGSISPRYNLALVPPVEVTMRIPVPFTKLLSEVNKALNPFYAWRRPAIWSGNPVPAAFDFGAGVRIVHLTPEETARLIRQCRAHDATLTGALYALVSHTLSYFLHKVEPASANRAPRSIGVFVPVSLRRYTGAPPTAICNHVSYYQDIHPLPAPSGFSAYTPTGYPPQSRFPWSAATHFSATLRRAAPGTPALLGVMHILVGSGERYTRGLLGKKRGTTLEISNLGPVNPAWVRTVSADGGDGIQNDGDAAWTMREVVFAQADVTLGGALKVNVTGTPAGGLGVSLVWGRKAMDEAFAKEWVAAFVEGLKELAS